MLEVRIGVAELALLLWAVFLPGLIGRRPGAWRPSRAGVDPEPRTGHYFTVSKARQLEPLASVGWALANNQQTAANGPILFTSLKILR